MDERNVKNTVILENFSRMKYLSLILICYCIFIIILDFGPFKVWSDEAILIYRRLDLLMVFVSVVTFLFCWFYKKENIRLIKWVLKIILLFVSIWAGIVTGIDYSAIGFSTLIVAVLVGVFFFYHNFLNSALFFIGGFIAFIFTVWVRNGMNPTFTSSVVVLTPIIFISILISGKNYLNRINQLKSNAQLIELNDELTQIKESLEEKVKHRTVELIRAKDKAEESDRLKTAFLANMSHEIRTPMNGILGFTELLKDPELSVEDQSTYIQLIQEGGDRLINIINNLIDISILESGMTKISLTETNINDQLRYIYSFFRPEVEGKGMHLQLKSDLPAEQSITLTDQEKIYVIMSNLINNSIKYSEKGVIEIGCSLKQSVKQKKSRKSRSAKNIETRTNHTELEFYVKDSGIGIDKDRQDAIFERFIHADMVNKKAYQGAGLGLTISKGYINLLGGRIWVESKVGDGSIFRFTIPYNPPMNSD